MNRDTVAAFGKIWIRFQSGGKEIRLPLHFLVERSEIGFDALCLELTCEGFGSSPKESVSDMLKDVAFLVAHSSQEDFIARYSEDFNSGDWRIFRALYVEKAFGGSPHTKLDAISDLLESVKCVQEDLENASLEVDFLESDFTTVQKVA